MVVVDRGWCCVLRCVLFVGCYCFCWLLLLCVVCRLPLYVVIRCLLLVNCSFGGYCLLIVCCLWFVVCCCSWFDVCCCLLI